MGADAAVVVSQAGSASRFVPLWGVKLALLRVGGVGMRVVETAGSITTAIESGTSRRTLPP